MQDIHLFYSEILSMNSMFLGYASTPEISREALYGGGREITSTGEIAVRTWEDLRVGGRLIISQVLGAIDDAALCGFDVSSLNENVLFELGYAIAREKRIWLLLEKTDVEATKRWKQFDLLKGVGYVGWSNAEDLRIAFLRDRPDLAADVLYHDIIEPELSPTVPGSLFYMPSYNRTEPVRQLSRRLDIELRRGVRLVVADPTETSLNPLQWYAAKVYETECSIFHFEAPRRDLASLHNPRSALVAGLAHGLERPILMLAEEDYSPRSIMGIY